MCLVGNTDTWSCFPLPILGISLINTSTRGRARERKKSQTCILWLLVNHSKKLGETTGLEVIITERRFEINRAFTVNIFIVLFIPNIIDEQELIVILALFTLKSLLFSSEHSQHMCELPII